MHFCKKTRQKIDVTSSTPASLPDPLAAHVAAWNAAGAHWNSEALANCFTEDGLFFGGRPEHSVGREAITAYFRSYIGTIASCHLQLRDQELLQLAPDTVAAQGYGDFSFVLGDGARTRSVVRTTLILVQQRDGWKARLQHFAPPPPEPPLGRNT
jgi:uncharacterized protein (TIGR02246 family)